MVRVLPVTVPMVQLASAGFLYHAIIEPSKATGAFARVIVPPAATVSPAAADSQRVMPPWLISIPSLSAMYSSENIASVIVRFRALSWKYLPQSPLAAPALTSSFSMAKLKVLSVSVLHTAISSLFANSNALATPARNFLAIMFLLYYFYLGNCQICFASHSHKMRRL